MYEYRANINRVVDGDTVDVDIDLGFGVWMKDERVRLAGIDTPESRTRDKVEKKFGIASKKRLKELLGKQAILKTQIDRNGEDAKGKFGRILGDFLIDGGSVCQQMIDEGQAVAYHGQNKEDVEAEHLDNRERLISEGKVSI